MNLAQNDFQNRSGALQDHCHDVTYADVNMAILSCLGCTAMVRQALKGRLSDPALAS